MIAFDSNILIYALSKNVSLHQSARLVFREISTSKGICSALIITETLYGNLRERSQLTPLLSPSIQIIPVTELVAELAGKLKIDYELKNADSIHLATAIIGKADIFITNDQQLFKKKIPGIKIRGL